MRISYFLCVWPRVRGAGGIREASCWHSLNPRYGVFFLSFPWRKPTLTFLAPPPLYRPGKEPLRFRGGRCSSSTSTAYEGNSLKKKKKWKKKTNRQERRQQVTRRLDVYRLPFDHRRESISGFSGERRRRQSGAAEAASGSPIVARRITRCTL